MKICTECGRECNVHEEEVGIGKFEYMGHVGNDRRFEECSDCCDSPVEEKDDEDYFWEEKFREEAEEVKKALKKGGETMEEKMHLTEEKLNGADIAVANILRTEISGIGLQLLETGIERTILSLNSLQELHRSLTGKEYRPFV